ncbi:MAG: AraC family transcriptional regulator [Leptospirales bacterium]|nr:AraC family transcriptional regulator [Leptospirales bacterium]
MAVSEAANQTATLAIPELDSASIAAGRVDPFFFAGRLQDLPPSFSEYSSPHRHPYCAVFYFQSGFGRHTIDFEEFTIEPGSIFLLKPRQVHCWRLDSAFSGYALKISHEFCAATSGATLSLVDFPFFGNGRTQAKIAAPQSADQLQVDLERLVRAFQNGRSARFLYALSHVALHEIADLYRIGAPQPPSTTRAYHLLLQLLDEHVSIERSVAFYAQRLDLPVPRLNRICQNESGLSARAVIRQRLLLEIRRLLIHSDLSILQIAREIRFEDAAYFSRFVKKNLGMSPETLRRAARKALPGD